MQVIALRSTILQSCLGILIALHQEKILGHFFMRLSILRGFCGNCTTKKYIKRGVFPHGPQHLVTLVLCLPIFYHGYFAVHGHEYDCHVFDGDRDVFGSVD